MKKLRIQQVSGNSRHASRDGDSSANRFLSRVGFVSSMDPRDTSMLYMGCVPADGKEFFVEYTEPATKEEKGSFRLTKLEGGQEEVIDQGTAGACHVHGGLGTLTFYASGTNLASWSFHCKQEEAVQPQASKDDNTIEAFFGGKT